TIAQRVCDRSRRRVFVVARVANERVRYASSGEWLPLWRRELFRELSAVVEMPWAARRRGTSLAPSDPPVSAASRLDDGYGGASPALAAKASIRASVSR